MITHDPLHGSGQADFPHPALALGDNAHASQGIRMTDGRQRQPASDEAPHTVPEDASVLTTPRQRTMPEPSHSESKKEPAPGCSWAPHNTGGVHAPPLATTCPGRGWVHACAAAARLSPRSASLAVFCESFAATPCTFRCSSSSRRYA